MEAVKSNTITKNDDWDLVITPERKWWDLRLNELWEYRDLVALFVRRDFVAQYKQTILGPLWHLINPIISTVIFTLIFNQIAGLPTDELPPFLFYLSGNVIWSYFSTCLSSTSNTFVGNQGMFGKVYFPRMVMPVSVVISGLISFLIRFTLFMGFFAYYYFSGSPVHLNWWAFLLPVLIFIQAGLGLSWGIIISSLTTKYRDLQVLVTFGVQLVMYATPVIYPASMVPQKFQWLYFLNPIAPIVETFRYAFLGSGSFSPGRLVYSLIFMIISFFIGAALFSKIEATFMDTV
jgi:lipopolysaccharide transport system permease protein